MIPGTRQTLWSCDTCNGKDTVEGDTHCGTVVPGRGQTLERWYLEWDRHCGVVVPGMGRPGEEVVHGEGQRQRNGGTSSGREIVEWWYLEWERHCGEVVSGIGQRKWSGGTRNGKDTIERGNLHWKEDNGKSHKFALFMCMLTEHIIYLTLFQKDIDND